jgi:hypothetical protein
MACKIGAARELFEETGMDLRNSLDRLSPIQVRKLGDEEDKLSCQYKKRVFFSVDICDDDLFTKVSVYIYIIYIIWISCIVLCHLFNLGIILQGLGLVKAINKDLSHLKVIIALDKLHFTHVDIFS